MKERLKKEIEKRAKKATPKEVEEVLRRRDELTEKVGKGPLKRVVQEVKLFVSLLSDFAARRYDQVPWYSVAAVAVALLYVLNPFDLVPDFIPLVGQVDDALVITLCFRLIEKDLERYEAWKRRQEEVQP